MNNPQRSYSISLNNPPNALATLGRCHVSKRVLRVRAIQATVAEAHGPSLNPNHGLYRDIIGDYKTRPVGFGLES